MTPIAVTNCRLLLLIHGSVPLVPTVTSHLRCDIESARSALALLLVIAVATASTATDVRGLLTLAHAWSTLAHIDTSAARRPTIRISGLSPAQRASKLHSMTSIATSPLVDSISNSGSAAYSLPVTSASNNPNTSPKAANIAAK